MTSNEVFERIASHSTEFKLGYDEGHDSMGMTYDNDSESPRSQAYDLGRSLRLGMDVS